MKLKDLANEFPRESVHWRAQKLTKKGDKALALAYLDARDVMDRLDEVCGPENWQDEYVESAKGRVICRIGIKVGDEWIWKSDGAGDTAVEGEKGGISDAYKRAAVKWGIGRYLYRLEAVWAPCTTYAGGDGKARFSDWIGSPWDHVRGRKVVDLSQVKNSAKIIQSIRNISNLDDLRELWKDLEPNEREDADIFAEKETKKADLEAARAHGVG